MSDQHRPVSRGSPSPLLKDFCIHVNFQTLNFKRLILSKLNFCYCAESTPNPTSTRELFRYGVTRGLCSTPCPRAEHPHSPIFNSCLRIGTGCVVYSRPCPVDVDGRTKLVLNTHGCQGVIKVGDNLMSKPGECYPGGNTCHYGNDTSSHDCTDLLPLVIPHSMCPSYPSW